MLQQQQQQQQQTQSLEALPADDALTTRTAVRTSSRQPHYQQPTTSTVLPEYANAEADVIRASFTTGNCSWTQQQQQLR